MGEVLLSMSTELFVAGRGASSILAALYISEHTTVFAVEFKLISLL